MNQILISRTILSFLCTLHLASFLVHHVESLPDIIKIGGLFDISESKQEVAFRYAVERINSNRKILPKSLLSAQIEKIPPQDSFHASKRVCHLLRSGVAALFGPQSGTTSSHVQSICDAMEIPHIETRWDYRLKRDDYSVNLYPHPTAISKAYVELIERFGWKSYTILYEDNQGLVRLQELLKSPTQSDVRIQVRQLPIDDDYRPLLKDIKKGGEIHIVLDCSTEKIQPFLSQAMQVGMMTAYHNYLITSLDLHMVNLEDFKYGGTNLTAFRLLDPERPEVKQVVEDWIYGEMRYGRKLDTSTMSVKGLNQTVLKTETALIYDAVHLFAQALHDLDHSQEINTSPLSCDGSETWQHGNSLVNYMKLVEMKGLTGTIKFDQHGLRSDFTLEIVELKKDGLIKVGVWMENMGVNFTRNFTENYNEIVDSLQNKTLVVTTIFSPPYSMHRTGSRSVKGNDAFEGYTIDLIKLVAEVLKFNYTFKWVDDENYGKRNQETGEWNGMIGELLSQKADLAIGDITITYEREQAVDFTMPWMNLGVSILFKKPMKKPPNLFSFMSPLSLDVWIYMATAYFGVSVLLFILARFSPYEWDNPHPCTEEPEVLVNEFSLINSMWFTIGSLMQQGSDLSPKAISTRMVAGMWWFFTLIMISSYTANLAAFLTVERMASPIESAEDLAKQTKIKYGCVESGSTGAFFRDSKIPTYQRMWSFMESTKPSVFVNGNPDGVERVKKENGFYAFLMESTSIEYTVERNCDTIQIGGLLDSKGYGIALPPGSPYRTPISSAILQLQEAGQLHVLKSKWWTQQRGGGQCQKEEKRANEANELSLANVGGVFVVLLAGMGLACLIAVFEFIWKSRKLATDENMDVWSEMAKEVRQNFGANGLKTVSKANTDSSGSGNGDKDLGIKACAPNGIDSMKRQEYISTNIDTIKLQVGEMKPSCTQQKSFFSSPLDSLHDKNLSSDSNSSGVQSNSYSDLSDNGGGCLAHRMENSSPEIPHRNLVHNVARGQCKEDNRRNPNSSIPQYPPPNYNSLNGNTQTMHTSSFPSASSTNNLSHLDHRSSAIPVSTNTLPYSTLTSHLHCSDHSDNRISSDQMNPLSLAQVSQAPKNAPMYNTKQASVYAYQTISGKVQLQKSTYDLRQSSKTPEVTMRSNNASTEAINNEARSNSCRSRYGINSVSRS